MAVGLAALAALGPLGAVADSTEDQIQALQAQADGQRAGLQQLGAQQAAALRQLASLKAALAGKQAQLAEVDQQAQQLDNQIAVLEAETARLSQAHDRRLRAFSQTVRATYERNPAGTLVYILGSGTFAELIDRAMSSLRIARFNLQEADRLRRERETLDADRGRTAGLKADLQPILDQLAAAAAAAGSAFGEAAALESQIEARQRATLAALRGTLAKQKQLEAQLAAEEAAAAAAAAKAQQSGGQAYGALCPAAPPGKVLICGHGWGHGVGLAQYGALGMAQAGLAYQQILTRFYSGVTIGGSPDQTMRVWLRAAGAGVTPQQAGATLQDTSGKVLATVVAGTAISFSAQGDGSVVGTWSGGRAQAKPLRVVPAVGGIFKAAGSGTRYRGEAWADGSSGLKLVDHVDIEQYLQGLAEVPSSWPAAALQAQTVAARTYALYHLGNTGTYDVDDTTAYQVYGGVDRETGSQNAAVAATAAQAIFYQGQLIDAVFSSSDGGHSQCASAEWGSTDNPCTPAYLKGVVDNYDVSPLHTWYTPAYTLAQIQQFTGSAYDAGKCGTLTGFDLSDRDASDRLNHVRMVGTRAVCSLTPGAFIRAFNAGSPPDAIVYGEMFGVSPGAHAWPYW